MSSLNEKATQLKEEGNALFIKKEFALASVAYTQAIAADGNNAVLYANRAACRLALRQYLDALTDAQKATELDPLYPKAFSRLATAYDYLDQPHYSIDAWKRALSVLPKENLKPGELEQKKIYLAKLKAAAVKNSGIRPDRVFIVKTTEGLGNMPWHLAQAMLPTLLENQNMTSSAWVISSAHLEFMEGIRMLKLLKTTTTPTGPAVFGILGGLSHLTNAVIRDSRVFFADDNWFDMYKDQMALEVNHYRAWGHEGPERIIEQAPARLREEGWGGIRPALATTIRSWIMYGFITGGICGKPEVAVEFLSRAIEVINWGQTVWKDVHSRDRGVIFEDTFFWGVRSMYIDSFMEAYLSDPGLNSKFPLEVLYEEANELIRDISASPPRTEKPVDVVSFVSYPKGLAFSAKGFYHAEMAKWNKHDPKASRDHYLQAAKAYLAAAGFLPEDEEQHVWFLSCAYTNFWFCLSPLRVTMPILKRIRLAIPDMKKIWANSARAKTGRDTTLQSLLRAEKENQALLEQGIATLDAWSSRP